MRVWFQIKFNDFTNEASMKQSPVQPDIDEVHAAVEAAIETLFTKDRHLISVNASERSMSHMLAIHLASRFSDYEVDCEYNRDGFDVKKLGLSVVGDILSNQIDAVTVFPDIIVHKRGEKNQNLLVLEVKKASSNVSHDYDIKKLKAFKSELNYRFAAHVVIGLEANECIVKRIEWQ